MTDYPPEVADRIGAVVRAARAVVKSEGPGQYVRAFEDLKEAVAALDTADGSPTHE